MSRSGIFSNSLTPFGIGKLNISDAYKLEVPKDTVGPPIPNAPPPRQVGGSVTHVPVPVPPIVGRTPYPVTTAPRPTFRPMAAATTPTAPAPAARVAAPPSTFVGTWISGGGRDLNT